MSADVVSTLPIFNHLVRAISSIYLSNAQPFILAEQLANIWIVAVVTVEKASAAKVFFECHYNAALSEVLTPRSLRRQTLESAMLNDAALSPAEKNDKRRAWAQRESDHLRETRAMKACGINALKGKAATASKYEVVKVLGKGSFGVVRLVREKSDHG